MQTEKLMIWTLKLRETISFDQASGLPSLAYQDIVLLEPRMSDALEVKLGSVKYPE